MTLNVPVRARLISHRSRCTLSPQARIYHVQAGAVAEGASRLSTGRTAHYELIEFSSKMAYFWLAWLGRLSIYKQKFPKLITEITECILDAVNRQACRRTNCDHFGCLCAPFTLRGNIHDCDCRLRPRAGNGLLTQVQTREGDKQCLGFLCRIWLCVQTVKYSQGLGHPAN